MPAHAAIDAVISLAHPGGAGGVAPTIEALVGKSKTPWFFFEENQLVVGIRTGKGWFRENLGDFGDLKAQAYKTPNNVTWPIAHEGEIDQILYEIGEHLAFREFNRKLAKLVYGWLKNKCGDRDDFVVSVQDYTLARLPQEFRQISQGRIKIMFSLHIPFPDLTFDHSSPSMIRSVYAFEEMANGMLEADIITVHTEEDRRNLIQFAKAQGLNCTDSHVCVPSHLVKVKVVPLGIPLDRFASAGVSKQVVLTALGIENIGEGTKIVSSVDRIDPAKFVVERFDILEALFERYPELIGTVTFVWVAQRSRPGLPPYDLYYEKFKRREKEFIEKHRTPEWTPLVVLTGTYTQAEVRDLYELSDVDWVSSRRDGMHLGVKEAIAAQPVEEYDPTRNILTVVLSTKAGAFAELGSEGAIGTSPTDFRGSADALAKAIEMPPEERWNRLLCLRRAIERNPQSRWIKALETFASRLKESVIARYSCECFKN